MKVSEMVLSGEDITVVFFLEKTQSVHCGSQ